MSATNDVSKGFATENADRMRLATAISPVIPIFAYEPANFKRHCDSAINIGTEVFHAIVDEKEFSELLGYKGVEAKELTFDEYIWGRYTRDGAQRTNHCLQVQLNAYLYKHSAKFNELYGDAYKKLIGDGSFICIDDISAICDSCAQLQALKK